jgi:hypothetical protein
MASRPDARHGSASQAPGGKIPFPEQLSAIFCSFSDEKLLTAENTATQGHCGSIGDAASVVVDRFRCYDGYRTDIAACLLL